jgi:hypothetical protein
MALANCRAKIEPPPLLPDTVTVIVATTPKLIHLPQTFQKYVQQDMILFAEMEQPGVDCW